MVAGNHLLTKICWHGNTFMSNGTIDEDAKVPKTKRGASIAVAGHQRGRSRKSLVPGVGHLSAAGSSISQRCASNRPCSTSCRAVGAGNLQNSRRCVATVARSFGHQRFDVEHNSHARCQELSDINRSSAPEAWLGGPSISLPQSRWSLLLIAWRTSSCSKPMTLWFRIAFAS